MGKGLMDHLKSLFGVADLENIEDDCRGLVVSPGKEIYSEKKRTPRESASDFVGVLGEIAYELLPEQCGVARYNNRYISELVRGDIPDCWALDRGGIVRMSYFDGELAPVDKSWKSPSGVYEGTLEEHWNVIKEEYIPRVKQFMDELGF